jgi:hypothetical protein
MTMTKAPKKTAKAETRAARPDGRAQLLIYMRPSIVIALKTAALKGSRPAYEIVEEAVQEWLKAQKTRKTKPETEAT